MKQFILTIALILPAILFGQLDRSKRPEAAAAPAINIKDSEVFKTENGITVILSENHKLPKVTFSLVMGASPELEGDKAGLSDIAGSLIMSGTSNRSKDQLDGEKDYIGASLSASSNSLRLSCLTKHMNKGLTLMSDVLLNASFPQEEVDRIIKQNESNLLSTKSDAGSMARNARSKINFPNHPFGEIMTEESLANINREAIVDFYKRKFVSEGSYLVVVGDINKETVKAVTDKYFSPWSGAMEPKIEWNVEIPKAGNRVVFVKKPGAVQSVISISFPMDIDPGHEDYLKLKVLNGVLGGGAFGNRLMQNLREDKAYTYGCRSSVNVNEDGSWMSAGGNFRNEVTDSAIVEILNELQKITESTVEDDEINLTKSSMAGGFARSLERPATIAQFALSIIKNELPSDYYQTYLKKLEAISKEDLLEVAKKYFTHNNCNIVVVGNEEVLDKLLVFDADGNIEKLDAFGNESKEILPADISADELLEKHILAITQSSSLKAVNKKVKKVKSMTEIVEVQMPQVPFPMTMTEIWIKPNVRGQKMEGQGMVFQKSLFDGETGASVNMQTGKKDFTPEEIAAKKKSVGLFPEMNFKTSGMDYEILGIEVKNGTECYVLKVMDGETEEYNYFDRTTYYKVASTKIATRDGETNESSFTYGDFEENNGFIFPTTTSISIGPMNMTGKIKSRTFNEKIDLDSYK